MTHVRVALKHSCFRDLDDNSFALLTEEPKPQRAVVFVHGFGGSPSGTWSQMPRYIERDNGWKDTDAYFIGYRSTQDELTLSADYLVGFIHTILPEPTRKLFRVTASKSDKIWLIRPEPPRYTSIDFIGHSLGGVVLRSTILKILKQGLDASGSDDASTLDEVPALACSARLLLFAPAQGGARPAGFIGLLANLPILKQIVALRRGLSASFQELVPDMQVLANLQERTRIYADRYPKLAALRAHIAWAHKDSIVTASSYLHDSEIRIRNTNHKNVCKPGTNFAAPFIFACKGTLTQDEGAIY